MFKIGMMNMEKNFLNVNRSSVKEENWIYCFVNSWIYWSKFSESIEGFF